MTPEPDYPPPPFPHKHPVEEVTALTETLNNLPSGPSSQPTWGNIAGTLSDQIDLSSALAGKAPAHDHPYEPVNANIQAHVASPHAPASAQANADITKAEIEAKLTGAITSHSHAGGSGQPIGYVVLANDTLAQNLATNINTQLTVTASCTLTTTVPAAGVRCSVTIVTSGTTSRTITFGTGFKPVSTLATGTTTGRAFVVNFISNGTILREAGRTAAMVV